MATGDGSGYLLHFEPPLKHARHYLGYVHGGVENIESRLAYHLAGQGSRLVRAAVKAGCEVRLVRTWHPFDRDTERQLKNRKCTPRLCPVCTPTREEATCPAHG
ncbi:MAG: endonuclease [Solirubrobacteraceae bacterium]